jgi:hypothetical protein
MMRPMHPNGDTSRDTSEPGRATGHRLAQRHSIPDAAKVLSLTEEAVRQRVKRGTLDSIKVDGKLFVLLNNDTSEDLSNNDKQPVVDTSIDASNDRSNDTSRLADALEDEIAHLRRQLDQANERDRENRRILAGLIQRVPELEAAPEPRESDFRTAEGRGGGDVRPEQQESSQRRSWWRAFLGLPH